MKKIYPILFFLTLISLSLSAQTVWDNFQDSRKGTYFFENGAFIPYFSNPDANGNTSPIVAQYTRNAAETFDVIVIDAQMANLSDYLSGSKVMTMDVWSPSAGTTIQISLENAVLAEPDNWPTGRHSSFLATTTVAEGWETLTFTFDFQPDATVANDNVDRMVILFAPNTNTGDTYYWDNLNGPELANDPCDGVTPDPAVFNDFECNQHTDFTFSHSGVNFRRVPNPDQNGNTSDFVATYTRNGGEENDVLIGKFNGALSFESSETINLDVWSSVARTVRLSLQNDNNEVILAVDRETSGNSAWETLTFFVGDVWEAPDITQFVILFDPESFNSDQYYFDNFGFGGPTSVQDLEEVISFTASPNPTQGETNFQYELKNASEVSLSIHDVTGRAVAQLFEGQQGAGTHSLTWMADGIPNGIYFYTMNIEGRIASGKIILNK